MRNVLNYRNTLKSMKNVLYILRKHPVFYEKCFEKQKHPLLYEKCFELQKHSEYIWKMICTYYRNTLYSMKNALKNRNTLYSIRNVLNYRNTLKIYEKCFVHITETPCILWEMFWTTETLCKYMKNVLYILKKHPVFYEKCFEKQKHPVFYEKCFELQEQLALMRGK